MTETAHFIFEQVPWIIYAPVAGLLINIFVPYLLRLINKLTGSRLAMSEQVIGLIATLATGLAFVVALLQVYALTISSGPADVSPLAGSLAWIHVLGGVQVDWALRVDTLSVTMMLVVSGVGTLIHIYAIGYMHEDVRFKHDTGRYGRFFVYLNLFIAAMMILVSGNSYLMLFVGWEGVGLCSFLLIGFWYELDTLGRSSWANSEAAKKAFVANRVGDFGFLVAMFIMFFNFKSLQFDAVFAGAKAATDPNVILAITLFLLIGVAGKSAQIPLYVWLPDAMAGPTPVSALIHAATMVTAGVYLVTRSAAIFSLSAEAQMVVASVGAVTALFAATIATGQYDIKKVLAYSTISQLGFMVAAVGMGAYVGGMFHLITHAFFKALLFLSAGSVILGMERGHHHLSQHEGHEDHKGEHLEVFDPGDMRNMGGLRKQMPVTFWLYLVGAIALGGIPPLAGFWSKDEILAEASKYSAGIYWLLTAAAFLTAFYMGRQIWLVFFGEPRHEVAAHAEESPQVMTVPLMVLAGLAVVGGALNLPTIAGLALPGTNVLTEWLARTVPGIEPGEFNGVVALTSTVLALAAIGLSWLLYQRRPLAAGQPDPLKRLLGPVFTGMENKWWVDELYAVLFVDRYNDLARFLAEKVDWDFWHNWFHDSVVARGFVGLTRFLADPVDVGIVDRVISHWPADFTEWFSEKLRPIQNGFVRSYALAVVVGVVAILGYLLLK